jgi:hypothetical protein
MQLRFSGRFSVTQAIWSSNSTRTFFPPGTFSVEVFSVEVFSVEVFSVEVFSVEVLADILIPSHLSRRTSGRLLDIHGPRRMEWQGLGKPSGSDPP